MKTVNPSSLRASHRVSFVARPNSTQTPMTKRTMHPNVDPGITPGDGSRNEKQREGQNQAQQSNNANNSANKSNNWGSMPIKIHSVYVLT